MAMTFEELKKSILDIATQMAQKGAGYAQEIVVLREVEDKHGEELKKNPDLKPAVPRSRLILTAWHDLFREGKLSWGYDLHNPNAPFFHVPVRETAREPAAAR